MKKSLFAAALACLPAVLLAGPEPAHEADKAPDRIELASPEVVVPLRMEKGRPIVEVAIDGKGPFPFVLDTGAGGTVLGSDLARELALPEEGEMRIGDPINPHAIAARRVRIGRLALGGATFSDMTATSMESPALREHLGARGVLGMPVFAELLLTLDFGRGEIRIGRGQLSSPDGKDVVAYRPGFGGTIRMPITVGALELDADVDSGSPAAVSLPNEYMDRLPLEAKPVEVGRARTVSSEFLVYGATLKGAVQIGGHRLENPALRFSQLPVANIGSQVLRRFAITIDQKSRRIRLAESPGGAAAADAPQGSFARGSSRGPRD